MRLPRDFCRGEALAALRRWVLLRAREVLPRLLTELAAEHGFEVGRIAVREMKSRWGSCSSRGNISLNARLLFLSSGLVRHVLLHELCHLREMNHSRAFYECLRDVDPEADRPQTAALGANSIAGSVIVNTKDPTFKPEGAAQLQLGSRKARRASVMLSRPLVDKELEIGRAHV